MYVLKMFVAIGLIVGLTACSSHSVVPKSTQKIDAKRFQPSSQNGVLYLVRNEDWRESSVGSTFYIDDKKIGTIGNESAYFVVELEPGTYTYKRIKEDIFGASEPIRRRVRVRPGFAKAFVVEGGFGYESTFDENIIKNHKFLGYRKIGK